MPVFVIFVPLLIFMAVCVGGFFAMLRFIKKTKVTTEMTNAGEAMHMETPLGTFDVRPETKLDARIASIPSYPGALPNQPGIADQVTEFHFRGQATTEVSTSYWTPDPAQVVQEFYARELPAWNRNLIAHTGWERVEQLPDCVRMVRVYTAQGRTIIEHSIKPADYLKAAAQRSPTPTIS